MPENTISLAEWVQKKYPNLSLEEGIKCGNTILKSMCNLDNKECLGKGESYHDYSVMFDYEIEKHVIQRVWTAYNPNGCEGCDRNLKNI